MQLNINLDEKMQGCLGDLKLGFQPKRTTKQSSSVIDGRKSSLSVPLDSISQTSLAEKAEGMDNKRSNQNSQQSLSKLNSSNKKNGGSSVDGG